MTAHVASFIDHFEVKAVTSAFLAWFADAVGWPHFGTDLLLYLVLADFGLGLVSVFMQKSFSFKKLNSGLWKCAIYGTILLLSAQMRHQTDLTGDVSLRYLAGFLNFYVICHELASVLRKLAAIAAWQEVDLPGISWAVSFVERAEGAVLARKNGSGERWP